MPGSAARSRRARRARRRATGPAEQPATRELVSCSLESARQGVLHQDYGTAFVHYLLVLNLAPVLKDVASESFRFTLFKWASELHALGRVQDLLGCYEQALELFPDDEVIVNSMGEHLFRMGFRDEAAAQFHKALKLRPDFAEARENFHRVSNWLVERWHFLMLNDHSRNRLYQLAIERAVRQGRTTVLDIGTGTGILGMCAKKAGASEVFACELSKTMYELACEVVQANGMADSIQIVHMKSLEMQIPRDIPARVSLVVTETVDAGLLGEGIVESLIHAWKHLLLPPPPESRSSPSQTGRVIPASATVFAMAVECPDIRRHHRLCVSAVGGLDLSAAGDVCSPVNSPVVSGELWEPYSTDRLSRLRGGLTSLTHPCRLMDIDFNNLQELEGLCSRETAQVRVPVVEDGVLDALAMWFQLQLDQENIISTGPHEDTCWEQAIYPVQGPLDFKVQRHDELLVEVSCQDTYLRLCCVAVVRDSQTFRLDGAEGGVCVASAVGPEGELCSALAGLHTHTHTHTPPHPFTLECSEISLLNNLTYHDSFRVAMDTLLTSLGSARGSRGSEVAGGGSSEPFYVLDVSEGFSVLSLMAARAGLDSSGSGSVRAYSSVEKEQHQDLLRLLAHTNGVEENALEFWLTHVEDDSTRLQRPGSEKLWSAIILDCIEPCGLTRQGLMEKATLARCLLEDGGRIFPERIVVHGLLVESDALLQESAVQGVAPTLGFNIAPFINHFTVPVHVFLDLNTLVCSHLSEPVELFDLHLMDSTANYTSRSTRVRVSAPGRVTAIPFWYQIYLDTDTSVSTFCADSHWKQAAVVLQRPLLVNTGDWVTLSVHLHNSSLSISAVKEQRATPANGPVKEGDDDHAQGGFNGDGGGAC
ncbi:protein arginine N-methyltransferase 9 isoform X2 [Brachyhypopomus gauderio]|uniref:protein arginine N-methyltransferase 9 isoform X2 n=1 Tax=Brachyhypopomus gauderio TaxID=698409 RepID=UPI00404316DE